MLKNMLAFHRIRVEDVMVPRADIEAVAADTNLGELLNLFRTAGHSRLPVYGETLDDPKGMVHIRDFLDFIAMRADSGASEAGAGDEAPPPSLGQVDLSMTLAVGQHPAPGAVRAAAPCRPSTCWCGCRRRAPTWPW